MANHGTEPQPGNDHHATYASFMSATKWAIGFVAVTLIALAVFLVR